MNALRKNKNNNNIMNGGNSNHVMAMAASASGSGCGCGSSDSIDLNTLGLLAAAMGAFYLLYTAITATSKRRRKKREDFLSDDYLDELSHLLSTGRINKVAFAFSFCFISQVIN